MIRNLMILIVISISSIKAFTTTVDVDTIKQNESWSDTILLIKPLTVSKGVILTISPGTKILVQPACSLMVCGGVFARGTSIDSILFSATDTSTGWRGMVFTRHSVNDSSVISFAKIQYARVNRGGGAINCFDNFGLILRNCLFFRNSCTGGGGAIKLDNSGLGMDNCVFINNHSDSGSGVIALYISTVIAKNCSFHNNSSVFSPSVSQSNTNYISCFIGCIFTGNISDDNGGCIYGKTDMRITNCTFTGNSCLSSCLNISSSYIYNSIFWKNSPSDTISSPYSLIQNCLIGRDPLFYNYDNGDFRLKPKSPCIDRGKYDTSGLRVSQFDLDGQPRINCGKIDIGAYESQHTANCPPFAIDTAVTISHLYKDPLVIDTSLVHVSDYDGNPVSFVIIPGTGFTSNKDTLFIDSARIDTLNVTVYATDGPDSSTAVHIRIKPLHPPVIRKIYDQTIHQGQRLLFTNLMIDVYDPDGEILSTVIHNGQNFIINKQLIIPPADFIGDLSVPIHVTDGIYSSDTLILTIHIVKNLVPILSEVYPQQIMQYSKLSVTMDMVKASDENGDHLTALADAGSNYMRYGGVIIPDTSFYGVLTIPIRVTDGVDTSEALPMTLSVQKFNHTPRITATTWKSFQGCKNIPITINMISAYDPDGDSIKLLVLPGRGYTVSGDNVSSQNCGNTCFIRVAVTDGVNTSPTDSIAILFLQEVANPVIPIQARPLYINGKLTVKNGSLCNQYGYPVQLKGMSSHGLQWYGNFMNQQSVEWLATDWHASVIRAAMYTSEGGYITDSKYKQKVKEIAAYAKASGIYCIIDWHILSDGDPNIYKNEALKFFAEMAQLYKNEKNILYEICNEPNGALTWADQIKPYAQEVINTIRTYDSTGVILVGSSTWSQDVDIAAKDPFPDKNIAYSLHFYSGTHGDTLRMKAQAALDSGLAIFVSEWGTSSSTGDSGVFLPQSDSWLRFLDSAGISWCNWSLCDKSESSAALKYKASPLGSWPDSMLSASGHYVRDKIRNDIINDPPTMLSVNMDTVRRGEDLRLQFQAFDPDMYQKLSWALKNQPSSMSIDSTGLLSWKSDSCGTYNITISVSDDSGSAVSTHFYLTVEPPVRVRCQPEEFKIIRVAQNKGEIIFRFNPRIPTSYYLKIYSLSGKIMTEITGIANKNGNGRTGTERIKTHINASGLYFIEFSYHNEGGKRIRIISMLTNTLH